MSVRRILSLWFPRLAAERVLRLRRDALSLPFAVVGDRGGAQTLVSLNPEAERAGLRQGQGLRDAAAICPALLTAAEAASADEVFLRALCRWAGKFSPWVAAEPPDAIVLDLTGCAHLFGGEQGIIAQITAECADLGLTVRAGIADTRGAAWALARYSPALPGPRRSGDAVEQEARATRSRAARHSRSLTGASFVIDSAGVVAPTGQMRQAIAPLPLAALRLSPEEVEGFARLGLRRVQDVMDLPRAALARRFGAHVLRRLDQALGHDPEPVNAAAMPPHFAIRISFPDPIGLLEDVTAGMDRLLGPLCAKLRAAGQGARRVRLEAYRCDGAVQQIEVNLARASCDPASIRPLLLLRLDRLDAGYGIDRLRLAVPMAERLPPQQVRAPVAGETGQTSRGAVAALQDLIGKLGARIGPEAVTRLHPADSHIPSKTAKVLAAAWSEPATDPWPEPSGPRPIVMFRPEIVQAPEERTPPAQFRWRGQTLTLRVAIGPERLLPEWWLDDPAWRSGARDYWRVEVEGGVRLWLFYAHGAEMSAGWFCEGIFA